MRIMIREPIEVSLKIDDYSKEEWDHLCRIIGLAKYHSCNIKSITATISKIDSEMIADAIWPGIGEITDGKI